MRLFCFGLGYSASRFIAMHGARFTSIAGTVRDPGKAAELSQDGIAGHRVQAFSFDGTAGSNELAAVLEESDALLVSVPPGPDGDPALAQFEGAVAASRLSTIVYLSTIGVYGDTAGEWVDETTPPDPKSPRSRARLDAEHAWETLRRHHTPLVSAKAGTQEPHGPSWIPAFAGMSEGDARPQPPSISRRTVAIIRLPGIYGPGRNALREVATGRARRIVKSGHVFNRVHVDDIAAAIMAVIDRRFDGIVNVTDDEPAPAGDPIAFAARLLGREPPPEIPLEIAARDMSTMALSFWAEHRRVSNSRLKRELGVTLTCPTYREGLAALHAAGEGAG